MPHKDIEERRRYQREYQRAYAAANPRKKRDWSKVNRTRSERVVPKELQCAREGCCKRAVMSRLCHKHLATGAQSED
tara:strand:+ start:13726 stop:13956 length:231 start_codon:yes stop_codon:yes gene_type:complete